MSMMSKLLSKVRKKSFGTSVKREGAIELEIIVDFNSRMVGGT